MRVTLARVLSLAVSQIFRATPGLTREKFCVRNCEIVQPCTSFIIVISRPNSTPYGCGLISFGSGGR